MDDRVKFLVKFLIPIFVVSILIGIIIFGAFPSIYYIIGTIFGMGIAYFFRKFIDRHDVR